MGKNNNNSFTTKQLGSGNFKEPSPQEKAHSNVSGAAYSITRKQYPSLQTHWVVRVGDKGGILNKSHIQNVLKALLKGPDRCIHLACRMQDGAVVYSPELELMEIGFQIANFSKSWCTASKVEKTTRFLKLEQEDAEGLTLKEESPGGNLLYPVGLAVALTRNLVAVEWHGKVRAHCTLWEAATQLTARTRKSLTLSSSEKAEIKARNLAKAEALKAAAEEAKEVKKANVLDIFASIKAAATKAKAEEEWLPLARNIEAMSWEEVMSTYAPLKEEVDMVCGLIRPGEPSEEAVEHWMEYATALPEAYSVVASLTDLASQWVASNLSLMGRLAVVAKLDMPEGLGMFKTLLTSEGEILVPIAPTQCSSKEEFLEKNGGQLWWTTLSNKKEVDSLLLEEEEDQGKG
jgi:hypothetical protein